MKNLLGILILITICFSIRIPYTEWDIEWNVDIYSIFDKLKTSIPEYIKNIQSKLDNFKKQVETRKNEIIKEITSKAKEEYEKAKENPKEYLKPLIEKATEAAKYMQYKICDLTSNTTAYEECRTSKKVMFTELFGYVKDNLQCSRIVRIITDPELLTKNPDQNLKYILFLINVISGNPDAIQQGTTQVIYDAMNCLQENFEKYWPQVEANFKDEKKRIELKQDITNLLIQSVSNLVNILHFEELDGYISKINEKAGLISEEKAKQIHQNIFKILKKLNEFGSQFYNISATMAIDVYVNPGNLEAGGDAEVFIKDLKERGIRVALHSNYLLREYGANSIQTVVFDSPLVSVRGKKQVDGGTSNTFVGITLYDKEGKEILVKDININDFKPIIYYKKKLFNAMKTCLFYNEEENKIENTGVETKTEILDGEEYIKCIPKHLTSFTIGSYNEASLTDSSNAGTIVLIIFITLLCLGLIIGGFIFYRKKFNRVDNSQLEQAFPNKKGLLS